MKTFALFLCLIATTADAEPLYLKCEGGPPSQGAIHSVRIDEPAEQGSQVEVDGYPAGHLLGSKDIWGFGVKGNAVAHVVDHGEINRITGYAIIFFSAVTPPYGSLYGRKPDPNEHFEGVCHKTERLF